MGPVREDAYLEAYRVSALTGTIVSSREGRGREGNASWPNYDFSPLLDMPSLSSHSLPN